MRRIQRAADKEELVKTLTSGENPPFKEISEATDFCGLGRPV